MNSLLSQLPLSLRTLSTGKVTSLDAATAGSGLRLHDDSGSGAIANEKPVFVSDVLARQVAVNWSEAVAIVGGLCATLAAAGRSAGQIPDVTHVGITSEGAITVSGEDRNSIASLGRVLHVLLATANSPAPLRLFVTHTISSDRYESVPAFAEALAYYEVPGREALIQAVYHRTKAARDVPSVAIDQLMNVEPQEKKPDVVHVPRRPVPRSAVAAGAALLVVAVALSVWYAGERSSASTFRTAAAQAANTVRKLGGDIRQAVGLAAAPSPAVEEPQPTAALRSNVKRSERQPSPAPIDSTPSTPSIDDRATGAVSDSAPSIQIAEDVAPIPARRLSVPAVNDSQIYSVASPEVIPPVTVLPQLPRPTTRSLGSSASSTIEVVVNETGSVDRVRLLSHPSRIQATMLLSAAKAWKFEPASHDGHAVKYRLLVHVPVAEYK